MCTILHTQFNYLTLPVTPFNKSQISSQLTFHALRSFFSFIPSSLYNFQSCFYYSLAFYFQTFRIEIIVPLEQKSCSTSYLCEGESWWNCLANCSISSSCSSLFSTTSSFTIFFFSSTRCQKFCLKR